MRAMHARLKGWMVLGLLAGCASPEIGVRQDAVNGTIDTDEQWPGVLGMRIEKPEGVASCTGVLIAPNLLLTARHCVSSTQPTIVCGSSPLAPPVAGANVFSTSDVTVTASSMAVIGERVEVPPDGDDECGFDIAAVILRAELPGTEVHAPRLDEAVAAGETFTAVGYGTTGSGGLGTRRVATEVPVSCVGTDCGISVVQETEWVAGDGSFCRSDSGAPAIDASGRVIGVVSKGINPCSTPVLSSTYAWREWIRSVGRAAAEVGAYPIPSWATEEVVDGGAATDAGAPADGSPATDAGEATGEGGCSVASGPTPLAPLLLVILCRFRRRRLGTADPRPRGAHRERWQGRPPRAYRWLGV